MGSNSSIFNWTGDPNPESYDNESWLLKYIVHEQLPKVKSKGSRSRSRIRFNPIVEESDGTYYQCEPEAVCHKQAEFSKYADEACDLHDFKPNAVSTSLYLSPASVTLPSNLAYYQGFADQRLYPNIRTGPELRKGSRYYSNDPWQTYTEEDEEPDVVRLNLRSVGIQATTHVILRVRAFRDKLKEDSQGCRPWVSMEYRFNRADDSEHFHVNGPMQSILPETDSNFPLIRFAYEGRLSYFFRNLDYFMNNLEGTIWWNGFIINLRGHPRHRLRVDDFAMEPTRLTICLRGLQDLELTRSSRRFQLRGAAEGQDVKLFTICGEAVVRLSTTFPKNGTILVHFPKFFSGM